MRSRSPRPQLGRQLEVIRRSAGPLSKQRVGSEKVVKGCFVLGCVIQQGSCLARSFCARRLLHFLACAVSLSPPCLCELSMFGRGLRCFDFANHMPFSIILLVGCCFTCDVSLLSLSFSVFLCLSLSFSVFLCFSLSFSVLLCLSLSLFFSLFFFLSLSLCLSLSCGLSLSLPFSVLLCPSVSLCLSVCAYAGAAARRARSLGDAAVFSPQGGGMLVLGAVGLLCLSRGELQAIKENRKQNRLAQKRRKNLLKADIVFCSCFYLVVVP